MDRAIKAIEKTLKFEGEYSNVSGDSGGETIFGITKLHHPKVFNKIIEEYRLGNTKKAEAMAKSFYADKYWNNLYNELKNEKLAEKLFDVSVNMGIITAVKILQTVLINYFNKRDLAVDGIFGKITDRKSVV
jgi:lysozyme family protein